MGLAARRPGPFRRALDRPDRPASARGRAPSAHIPRAVNSGAPPAGQSTRPLDSRAPGSSPVPREDTAIPVAEVEVLWSATAGCSAARRASSLHELGERGPLSRQGTRSTHDLQRSAGAPERRPCTGTTPPSSLTGVSPIDRGVWWTLPDEHGPLPTAWSTTLGRQPRRRGSSAPSVTSGTWRRALSHPRHVRRRRRSGTGPHPDTDPRDRSHGPPGGSDGVHRREPAGADCASTLRALATGEPGARARSAALTRPDRPGRLKRTVPLPEHARPALLRTIGDPKTTVGGFVDVARRPLPGHGMPERVLPIGDPRCGWTTPSRSGDVRTGRRCAR